MIKYDPMELFAMLTDATRKVIINQAPSMWDDPAIADIPVPEGFDEAWAEALEREAQRAEHEGLMVCGDDEWGKR
jgi:hypothetical protein